jgi:hypothetical protein
VGASAQLKEPVPKLNIRPSTHHTHRILARMIHDSFPKQRDRLRMHAPATQPSLHASAGYTYPNPVKDFPSRMLHSCVLEELGLSFVR